MVGRKCHKVTLYVHRLSCVFLASYTPFCHLVFFPSSFPHFFFLPLLPFCSLSVYGAPLRSETAFVFENSVLRVTLEQDEYPSRLVCRTCKPTSWLELWLFPARLLNSECMTMMWRFCVFNLPRVNKTEPLYFYSLLLCLGITLLPLYSRVSCPFRLSHRWQINPI